MVTNKWMFFDLGGTLIDESMQEKHIIDTITTEFERYGVVYSKSDIYDAMKLASANYKSIRKEAIRTLSSNQEQYDRVLEKAVYIDNLEKLYPYAIETLEYLSKYFKLGVIANQAFGAVDRIRRHKIHKYFSVFAISSDIGVSKPDKRIFEYALQKAECLPEIAFMVGDRLDNDIYPAKILGMKTIRVLQGIAKYQKPLNIQYEPDFTVNNISEVIQLT